LISVTNDHIKKYQEVFKRVGLRLIALESESLALIRSVISRDPTPTILLDIGAKSTNIVIAEGGYIKHNSQTDFGGAILTQSIGAGLGISSYRAEELKKRYGLLGTGGNYELSTLMMSSLGGILSEVERAINEYERRYESTIKRKLERVILSGGGAKLLGIDKYFEKRINLPVVRSDPFSRVSYPSEINPIIKEVSSSFSVAIGLGIRQLT
jgi:type IV pilus assembly protein PilM